MKKSIRYLVLLMAICMVSLILAACAVRGGGTPLQDGEVERVSVTWAIWPVNVIDDDNEVKSRIEDRFPEIDIEFIFIERANYYQILNTRIAAGDVPDILWATHQPSVATWARQDVIMEVTYEFIREHAPITFAATLEYGPEVWLAALVDGINYGVPIMQPAQRASRTNYWRPNIYGSHHCCIAGSIVCADGCRSRIAYQFAQKGYHTRA